MPSPTPPARWPAHYLDSGENPPFGVPVTYHLKSDAEDVCITVLDEDGKEIKRFSGKDVPVSAGMNRFVWDLHYPNAPEARKGAGLTPQENPTPRPPLAPPGTYKVKLTVGDVEQTENFEVLIDPTY